MLRTWQNEKKKKLHIPFSPYVCFWFPSPPPPPSPSHTLTVLWSIRLSVHSQKWLWHLLKRPVECSGLKGYPMLWPKTTRFFFFSLSFPSKTPLWHCALACWLSDQSLNIFKLPPMKDAPSQHHSYSPTHTHAPTHLQTWWHTCTHTGTLMYTNITEMQNTQTHTTQKKGPVWNHNHCSPALSMRLKYFMSTPKTR